MAAPQQGGNPSDNSAAILWWVAAIFAVIGALWYVFKNNIISGYLAVKLYELNFIGYLASVVGHVININPAKFDQVRSLITYARVNPGNISYADLLGLGAVVGEWLRIPLMLLMLGLAVAVYFTNTVRVFKRTYNMEDLAKLEKNNWPQITPIVGLNLIKTDIDTGPWAMAMTPMQFCKKNNLLEQVKPQRYEGMARKDWDRVEVVLKRGDANRVFALQLGPLWKGVNALPPYAKALFAVFAARINADSKDAAQVLRQLNVSSGGTLDLTGVDALLAKHENSKLVQKIVQSHAYVLTVMASMLAGAREDGVQASADFLWLKPRDRRLWYTLNTVGRQTPFIEVAGIYAHWMAEKEAGRKFLVPMVEEASHALELALKEVVYKPDEE